MHYLQACSFEKVWYRPDPMVDPEEPEHYLPLAEAILQGTTKKDCPSLKNHKPQKALSYSPSAQHTKNTNTMV